MTVNDAFRLFDQRARAVLVARGADRGTAIGVARVLGVGAPTYSKTMRGTLGSWDTLVDWLGRWHRAGLPALGILDAASAAIEPGPPFARLGPGFCEWHGWLGGSTCARCEEEALPGAAPL